MYHKMYLSSPSLVIAKFSDHDQYKMSYTGSKFFVIKYSVIIQLVCTMPSSRINF